MLLLGSGCLTPNPSRSPLQLLSLQAKASAGAEGSVDCLVAAWVFGSSTFFTCSCFSGRSLPSLHQLPEALCKLLQADGGSQSPGRLLAHLRLSSARLSETHFLLSLLLPAALWGSGSKFSRGRGVNLISRQGTYPQSPVLTPSVGSTGSCLNLHISRILPAKPSVRASRAQLL